LYSFDDYTDGSSLAYGMAAVAFWRAGLMLKIMGIDLDY
jgi:hypothetical protein